MLLFFSLVGLAIIVGATFVHRGAKRRASRLRGGFGIDTSWVADIDFNDDGGGDCGGDGD